MIDHFILGFDRALRTLTGVSATSREMPGGEHSGVLADSDRRRVAALMRVNHTGEVCAQALYQGQAMVARDPTIGNRLRASADEETEHLAWTAERIAELGGRTSCLNPAFFVGAFAMGVAAGLLGDRVSLGFLRETERQVVDHLDGHLMRLPEDDARSRAILEQMRIDEAGHAATAEALGAVELPAPVPHLMRAASRVMTRAAYLI